MQLNTSDGQSFSLSVERYEFPDEELGPTEDNPADELDQGRFLIVRIAVTTSDGEWSAAGPEMTTTELERLANWLEELSSGKSSKRGVYFTERNLEFTVDESVRVLTVHLFGDFLAPWAKEKQHDIAFPIDQLELAGAVSSLRSQLEQFPGRPKPS